MQYYKIMPINQFTKNNYNVLHPKYDYYQNIIRLHTSGSMWNFLMVRLGVRIIMQSMRRPNTGFLSAQPLNQ